MSGFKKAKGEQAALKMGFYGAAGSGKTFTALLCAEGIASIVGKRIAFVDTERGTDFYCKDIPDRKVHPKAFDFDALYTKSIVETLENVKALDTNQYGVVIIDSITHIWEAAKLAYTGKLTSIGTIPMPAWYKIKKPYKELVNFILSSPMHGIFCGRQGNEFDEDEETGELKKVGTKMKAEGETPYEPHILIHFETVKNAKTGEATITAFAEKDRTGVLSGKTINNPDFTSLVKPLLQYLGGTQAQIAPDSDTANSDAEKLTTQDANKERESSDLLRKFTGRIASCESAEQLAAVGKEITADIKKKMIANHVSELREQYLQAEKFLGK